MVGEYVRAHGADVIVHLVDGTYELFRCFHGAPRAVNRDGRQVGAVRAFFATMVALLREPGVSHVAVAFDSVVAPPGSARAQDAESMIGAQAPLAADLVRSLGLTVWPTGRYQADELIASGAARFAADAAVDQVVICSNDNDFNQCVRADRVVVLDRSRRVVTNEAAVRHRYGVSPMQLPDLFALVGDRSDGLPGVPGWGLRSAAALLGEYGSLAAIPCDAGAWTVRVRGAERLAASLLDRRDEALLCRDLSELRTDLPLRQTAVDLARREPDWKRLDEIAEQLEDSSALDRLRRVDD